MQELIANLNELLKPAAEVYFEPELNSTNSELKRRAARGELKRPTLLIAGWQNDGRGTRGRHWLMPRPNYPALQPLDVALTLAWQPAGPRDLRLSLAIAAVVAQALDEIVALQRAAAKRTYEASWQWHVKVKWPNDLVCTAGQPPLPDHRKLEGIALGTAGLQPVPDYRKLGGILLESAHGWLFAGIGLNINSRAYSFPDELQPAICTLREMAAEHTFEDSQREEQPQFTTPAVDFAMVLQVLCRALVLELVVQPNLPAQLAAWHQRDVTGGTRYTLCRDGRRIPVVAGWVDMDSGELVCGDANGGQHRVLAYSDLEPAPAAHLGQPDGGTA